jgi:hypothetical protein
MELMEKKMAASVMSDRRVLSLHGNAVEEGDIRDWNGTCTVVSFVLAIRTMRPHVTSGIGPSIDIRG